MTDPDNQSDSKQLELISAPSSFASFADLCTYAKDCVYVIARLRTTKEGTRLNTLGTGFLCAPFRLMTCEHVLNEQVKHEDEDMYLLIQRDEYGRGHRTIVKLELDKTLFLYPDSDTAVVHLPDSFYKLENDEDKNPDKFLKLTKDINSIGTEVGVLGYPLTEITLTTDKTDVDVTSIILRADRGVINSAYSTPEDLTIYQFTMSFNPGNSGGPIFETRTGKVISVVKAYNSIRLKFIKESVPAEEQKELGTNEVHSTIRTLYSRGLSTTNILKF